MKQRHSIDLLFSLSLFMVFVICSFLVLLFQVNGYHRIEENGVRIESIHTPLAYVETQLRTHDESGMIDTFQHAQISGLKIYDNESRSVIYIYENHHSLMELRIYDGITPDFTTGSPIFDIQSFQVKKENNKFYVSLQDRYDQKQTLTIRLKSN